MHTLLAITTLLAALMITTSASCSEPDVASCLEAAISVTAPPGDYPECRFLPCFDACIIDDIMRFQDYSTMALKARIDYYADHGHCPGTAPQ